MIKQKKLIALALSLAYVMVMLTGCGRSAAGKADGGDLEKTITDDWYEVDQEAGILTVRLPAEKEGFTWNFTINDTSLLELLTQEDNNNKFVASFRALNDGETAVSFTYSKYATLEEIRALNVVCRGGKVADASDAP